MSVIVFDDPDTLDMAGGGSTARHCETRWPAFDALRKPLQPALGEDGLWAGAFLAALSDGIVALLRNLRVPAAFMEPVRRVGTSNNFPSVVKKVATTNPKSRLHSHDAIQSGLEELTLYAGDAPSRDSWPLHQSRSTAIAIE